jgi:DNA-binding transcriptional ArsR family regulator
MLAVTYISFRKDQYNQVEKVLKALSERDKSFKYWIKERKVIGAGGSEYLALVRSYSLEQAHKRGLLITRRYLAEIKPPLTYKVFESSSVSRQIDLQTQSLKTLSDVRALSLLVALKSAKPMSVRELSRALGINEIGLRLTLRKLRKGELVTDVSGKVALSELGSNLLTKLRPQGGGSSERE